MLTGSTSVREIMQMMIQIDDKCSITLFPTQYCSPFVQESEGCKLESHWNLGDMDVK